MEKIICVGCGKDIPLGQACLKEVGTENHFHIGCAAINEVNKNSVLKDKIAVAIMTNIANGTDERGHFLSGFAKAFCRTDLENQRILMPAVHQFIAKYKIEETQRTRGILHEAQYM